MITQTREQWFRPVIFFGANFHSVTKNCFGKKLDILFCCVNLRKKPQKKEKIAKVLKPQKLKKKQKSLVQTLPIKDIFHFLSLNNETVEIQYELMVGFKVVSYFKLIILCWIFYLCSKDYQDGFC